MTELRAFHGDPAIKAKYIARVEAHRVADELIRGVGWENGRGCAIGCTLDAYDHSRYPIELGLPEWFARLEDAIFEGLPVERALCWPSDVLRAIPVGAVIDDELRDELAALRLERLLPRLSENTQPYARQCEAALRQCVGFLRSPSKDESARSAARSAAESARSAAERRRAPGAPPGAPPERRRERRLERRRAPPGAPRAPPPGAPPSAARSAARSAAERRQERRRERRRERCVGNRSGHIAAAARGAHAMTPSAILYAAADYMREHGFSPEWGKDGCPRCFTGSMSLGCSPLGRTRIHGIAPSWCFTLSSAT